MQNCVVENGSSLEWQVGWMVDALMPKSCEIGGGRTDPELKGR